jgi:hypothetical protein
LCSPWRCRNSLVRDLLLLQLPRCL